MASILLVFYFVMNRNSFLGTTPAPILYKLLYLIRWAKQNRVLHLIIWCLVNFFDSNQQNEQSASDPWKWWTLEVLVQLVEVVLAMDNSKQIRFFCGSLALCIPWSLRLISKLFALSFAAGCVNIACNTSSIVRLNELIAIVFACKMMHLFIYQRHSKNPRLEATVISLLPRTCPDGNY